MAQRKSFNMKLNPKQIAFLYLMGYQLREGEYTDKQEVVDALLTDNGYPATEDVIYDNEAVPMVGDKDVYQESIKFDDEENWNENGENHYYTLSARFCITTPEDQFTIPGITKFLKTQIV